MNRWCGLGRLVRESELRYAQTGTAVLRFSVAINRGKDSSGNDRGADFPSCVAFGKTAENIAKFFHKGDMIGIEGRIQTGNYEKDGKKVYTTDIVIDRFHFTGGLRSDGGMSAGGGHGDDYLDDDFHLVADDDDVPF